MFYSLGTKQRAEFSAFVTDFTDSFSPNWNTQHLFGRMDPVMNIQNVDRTISLAFDVPAASDSEAKSNLAEINKLIQFLYPTYSGGILKGNPLVKVQFQNLIASAKGAKSNAKSWKGDPSKNGLITAITSLSCTPDFDSGSVVTGKSGLQYPKLWRVNMSMQVLHNHLPGANNLRNLGFPYAGAVQSALNPQGKKAGDDKAVASQGVAGEQPEVGGEPVPDAPNDQTPGAKATPTGGPAAAKTAQHNPGGPGSQDPAAADPDAVVIDAQGGDTYKEEELQTKYGKKTQKMLDAALGGMEKDGDDFDAKIKAAMEGQDTSALF